MRATKRPGAVDRFKPSVCGSGDGPLRSLRRIIPTTIMATTLIGRLMAKHQRHEAVVRYPPMTGPILKPTPDTMAKIVQLMANSDKETPSARIVWTDMLTPAAPTPCMARPRRRTLNFEVGDPVQMAEPITMTKIAD